MCMGANAFTFQMVFKRSILFWFLFLHNISPEINFQKRHKQILRNGILFHLQRVRNRNDLYEPSPHLSTIVVIIIM